MKGEEQFFICLLFSLSLSPLIRLALGSSGWNGNGCSSKQPVLASSETLMCTPCTHTHMQTNHTCTHMQQTTHAHVQKHTHDSHVHKPTQLHMQTCKVHKHVHSNAHTQARTHLRTHMHTYTLTQTRTHTHNVFSSFLQGSSQGGRKCLRGRPSSRPGCV